MKILFDQTQKERGRIFSNFSILESDLTNKDYNIAVLDSFPIKYSSISSADVLVFLCPDGSKLYGHEIKGILRFVREGGILAVFSNAGGDNGLNTNMNSLLSHFNIELVPNQIFDYQDFDFEMETCPIIKKFFDHPITASIESLTYVSGCSLHIDNDVHEIARTQNSSDPPSATTMAVSAYGEGKIFVSGSYLMFSNQKVGIMNRDNRQLMRNLFDWFEVLLDEKKPVDVDSLLEETREDISEEDDQETLVKPSSVELSDEEIGKLLLQIKEIEAEVDKLQIDDPSYKEIIITDIARRKGIDYTKIHHYLEEKREEQEQKKETESQISKQKIETPSSQSASPISHSSPIEKKQEKPVIQSTPSVTSLEKPGIASSGEELDTKISPETSDILVELRLIKNGIEEINENIKFYFDKLIEEIKNINK